MSRGWARFIRVWIMRCGTVDDDPWVFRELFLQLDGVHQRRSGDEAGLGVQHASNLSSPEKSSTDHVKKLVSGDGFENVQQWDYDDRTVDDNIVAESGEQAWSSSVFPQGALSILQQF